MDKDTINRQYFGHDAFRPGQGQLIDAILSGRDSLGIMPTGGGKSLCYQVPALMLPGLTLVISPLISLIAVDEAHCISQWGQDFRPSYLSIPDFVDRLPRQPENRTAELLDLLEARKGRSGIVYCATWATVEEICGRLNEAGIGAARYHAGLSEEERRQNQDAFQFDRKNVMVATNAFGMGIDKSNVSFVIHYNMPKSLEAYYQEAGRAGRDGEPAECILFYAGSDVLTAKYLIENSRENEALSSEERETVRRRDYQRLETMIGYCRTAACLRGYLLDYFGQEHPASCGNCGNCCGAYTLDSVCMS